MAARRWSSRLAERLGLRHPIVQAPLAGAGPPALVAAVSEAGALGSLGAARLSPDELRAAIGEIRARTSRPFGVNLFAPVEAPAADAATVARVRAALAPHRDGPQPSGLPASPPFTLADQLEVVVAERVAVFSFTFGLLGFEAARDAGSLVIATATTTAEAIALEEAGVDAIVLQGFEAGGHRGSFLAPMERSQVGLMALVPAAADVVSVPLIAAGAISDGRGIAAALTLGADAVQLGTAFMACPESSIDERWRAALAGARDVASLLTESATGRMARLVPGDAVDALIALGDRAPYPLQAALLRETGTVPWLTGQASGRARAMPAGELVATLAAETDAALGA